MVAFDSVRRKCSIRRVSHFGSQRFSDEHAVSTFWPRKIRAVDFLWSISRTFLENRIVSNVGCFYPQRSVDQMTNPQRRRTRAASGLTVLALWMGVLGAGSAASAMAQSVGQPQATVLSSK